MNKFYIAIAAVVVIAGGAAAYLLIAKPGANNSSSKKTDTVSVAPLSTVKACDVLTEDIAKDVLGAEVTQPDGSIGDISTSDIAVTNCNFTTKITSTDTSSLPKASGVSVLARVAKTQAGANDNKTQFKERPDGVEDVSGFGDAAFYNPSFRQLNILKGNNWYIVTYYIDSVTNASLDTDKKLAEKIQFK